VTWQEAGEEHVGTLGKLEQHFFALGHRHVKADAALAAVGVLDVRVGVALDTERAGLAQPALRVTGECVLDLDDVGAPNSPSTAPADGTKPYMATRGRESLPAASQTTRRDRLGLEELLQACGCPSRVRCLIACSRRNGLSGLKYMPPFIENVPVRMRRPPPAHGLWLPNTAPERP